MKKVCQVEKYLIQQPIENSQQQSHFCTKKSKIRISVTLNLTDLRQLSTIMEESTEHQEKKSKTFLDIKDSIDPTTLKKIQSYKALKLPTLRHMDEEEILIRYISDPFFRKKLEYELQFLKKSTADASFQKKEVFTEDNENCIEIESKENCTTFKEVKLSEEKRRITQKNNFEKLIRRVSFHEHINYHRFMK